MDNKNIEYESLHMAIKSNGKVIHYNIFSELPEIYLGWTAVHTQKYFKNYYGI